MNPLLQPLSYRPAQPRIRTQQAARDQPPKHSGLLCGVPLTNNLSKAGFSWGWVSAVDSQGRTIWIVDAHRGDGRRFIVHADEKLSAFVELERQVLTVTFYLESIQGDSCQ
jgi:hypothetical protein